MFFTIEPSKFSEQLIVFSANRGSNSHTSSTKCMTNIAVTFPRLTKVDSHLIVHINLGNSENLLHVNANLDNDRLPYDKKY